MTRTIAIFGALAATLGLGLTTTADAQTADPNRFLYVYMYNGPSVQESRCVAYGRLDNGREMLAATFFHKGKNKSGVYKKHIPTRYSAIRVGCAATTNDDRAWTDFEFATHPLRANQVRSQCDGPGTDQTCSVNTPTGRP